MTKSAEQLRLPVEVAQHDYDGSTVIVLVGNVTRVTRAALNYAQSIGDYVIAMHVSMDEIRIRKKKPKANSARIFRRCDLLISTHHTVPSKPQLFASLTSSRATPPNGTLQPRYSFRSSYHVKNGRIFFTTKPTSACAQPLQAARMSSLPLTVII